MYLPDRVVSATFRARLLELIPGLGDHAGYWRLLGHLAFSGWTDRESGELYLPSELLAEMECRKHDSNYSGWRFLESFQAATGVTVEVRPHDWGQWRRVISVSWPNGVDDLLRDARRVQEDSRVLLSTGVRWRREHQVQDRRLVQSNAMQHLQDAGCIDAFHLLTYLNGLAPNRFSAIKSRLPDAHALVDSSERIKDKERQHNILQAIRQQAQPFYGPVDRSVRIFSINDSILRLQRDVRTLLTSGWVSADLRSAQLAIVARIWDVPEISEFLQTGKSIWQELASHLRNGMEEPSKDIVKDALYMTVFGAGIKRLRLHFTRQFGDARTFDLFASHSVVAALLKARNRQLRRIRANKGATDAYGNKIDLAYSQVPDRFYCYDNSRSIMAQVAQSYELRLLSPVIRMAVECKEEARSFTIMTWLHDGFTFAVAQHRDVDRWKKLLSTSVQEVANELKIRTELEFASRVPSLHVGAS